MKRTRLLPLVTVLALFFTSCFEDQDDNLIASSEINDFVWKAMNVVYLYKDDVPDLADDRFNSNSEYSNYLNNFATPEAIFASLLYLPETVDKFSAIIPNYFDFQQQQQGISVTKGLEFNLYTVPGSSTEVFGVITLVLNNSAADNAGLLRGQVFRGIDGTDLNTSNLGDLLGQSSYTLNFADYNDNGTPEVSDDTVVSNGQTVQLAEEAYTENPVHRTEVLNVDGVNVGYLMYNGFNGTFNAALNDAFSEFQSNNVEELVIDLRYNGGGSVQTAAYMGSMVTGQFNGQIYSKLFYNSSLESNNTDFLFTNTIDGVGAINSLNLSKVYILTTNRRTASASELVINSLASYINVVQIGENTVGKTQASITVYDSPTLGFEDVNPNHTYALQPLVANSSNADDQLVP
ncbi:MAG: S41 family peptidase, partial [Bacteroidota bacterium]